jgi:hypothetical protein
MGDPCYGLATIKNLVLQMNPQIVVSEQALSYKLQLQTRASLFITSLMAVLLQCRYARAPFD